MQHDSDAAHNDVTGFNHAHEPTDDAQDARPLRREATREQRVLPFMLMVWEDEGGRCCD